MRMLDSNIDSNYLEFWDIHSGITTSGQLLSFTDHFGLENILDHYPKNIFRDPDDGNDKVLVVGVTDYFLDSTFNSIYIGNTNADTVTLTVRRSDNDNVIQQTNQITGLLVDTLSYTTTTQSFFGFFTQSNEETYSQVWFNYSAPTSHYLEVSFHFNAGDSQTEIGTVRAGATILLRNPEQGFKGSYKDYSITQQLSTGATYYKQRDIVRTFTGTLLLTTDSQSETFRTLALGSLARPIAWNLMDNYQKGVLFGKLESMPSTTYQAYEEDGVIQHGIYKISFSVIEVI